MWTNSGSGYTERLFFRYLIQHRRLTVLRPGLLGKAACRLRNRFQIKVTSKGCGEEVAGLARSATGRHRPGEPRNGLCLEHQARATPLPVERLLSCSWCLCRRTGGGWLIATELQRQNGQLPDSSPASTPGRNKLRLLQSCPNARLRFIKAYAYGTISRIPSFPFHRTSGGNQPFWRLKRRARKHHWPIRYSLFSQEIIR